MKHHRTHDHAKKEQEAQAQGTGAQPPQDGEPAGAGPDLLALEAKVAELTDSYLRTRADLDNYRRRTEREKEESAAYAGANVLLAVLPVLDDLDRAAAHLPDDLKDHAWAQGITHVRGNLEGTLRRLGVERFGAPGDPYDAERHEAVARGPGPADRVTSVYEAGYLYKDRVLRPAKVQVGGGDPAPASDNQPLATSH